jgi:hypothetical protein
MLENTGLKIPHFLREVQAVPPSKIRQRKLEYESLQVVHPRKSIPGGPFVDPGPDLAAIVHHTADFARYVGMIGKMASIGSEKFIHTFDPSVEICLPELVGHGCLFHRVWRGLRSRHDSRSFLNSWAMSSAKLIAVHDFAGCHAAQQPAGHSPS